MSGHKGLYDKYTVLGDGTTVIRRETGEACDGAVVLKLHGDSAEQKASRIALAVYAACTHNPRLADDLRDAFARKFAGMPVFVLRPPTDTAAKIAMAAYEQAIKEAWATK